MENYFQAEAFNLDKVLDEFEQNEGELLWQSLRDETGTRFSCGIEVSDELLLGCHYVTNK